MQPRNNILFISHIDKSKPVVLVPLFLTPRLSFQIVQEVCTSTQPAPVFGV